MHFKNGVRSKTPIIKYIENNILETKSSEFKATLIIMFKIICRKYLVFTFRNAVHFFSKYYITKRNF